MNKVKPSKKQSVNVIPNNKFVKTVYRLANHFFLLPLVHLAYGKCMDDTNSIILLKYVFFQKILGFNRRVPWPVHFTSSVNQWQRITIGKRVAPGKNHGCYIQGINRIIFGDNVHIGPNVSIISANHLETNYGKHQEAQPIKIGSNVWLGANCVVLPSVNIGSNVIIGAGSIVTRDIPANSVAAGNPCRILREKMPYIEKF